MADLILESDEVKAQRRRTNTALLVVAILLLGVWVGLRFTRPGKRIRAAIGPLPVPMAAVFGSEEGEPWAKPVPGKEMARSPSPRGAEVQVAGADGGPLRPPEVPKVRAVDGSYLATGPIMRGPEGDPPVDPVPKAQTAEATASRERARMNPFPSRAEAGAARSLTQPSAFGAQESDTPARDRLPGKPIVSVGPVKAQGPVARAGPVQRALPVGRSGGFAPTGSAGAASASASAGSGTLASGQQVSGVGAGFGAAQTGTAGAAGPPREAGGGSWGAPLGGARQGGRQEEEPAVKLAAIGPTGKFWGLDLSTLYKKLREAGVTADELRQLEDCLVGKLSCKGGDIWEACTIAKIYNRCAGVCATVPGCQAPAGTNSNPNPNSCTPAPGCAEPGTIVQIEHCGDQGGSVFTSPTPCCSCDTSNYVAQDPSPVYSNTGMNCGISCPTGSYCVHFCSH